MKIPQTSHEELDVVLSELAAHKGKDWDDCEWCNWVAELDPMFVARFDGPNEVPSPNLFWFYIGLRVGRNQVLARAEEILFGGKE